MIAISSGHSKYVAGAIGIVKEVEEARKITDRFASLAKKVVEVKVFHDDVSRSQKDNINRIKNWHSSTKAKIHYSMHLNASAKTESRDIGVEVLYRFNEDKSHAEKLAKKLSEATGLKNRGAKQRTDLGFLSSKNRLLIEAYFVNSKADVLKMDEEHEVNAFAKAMLEVACEQLNIKNTVDKNIPCRVLSGTFDKKEHAELAKSKIAKLGIASEKYTKIVQDGLKWRFLTGTYENETRANQAIESMKTNKVLKAASIMKV